MNKAYNSPFFPVLTIQAGKMPHHTFNGQGMLKQTFILIISFQKLKALSLVGTVSVIFF
jgi:hypothetical protein